MGSPVSAAFALLGIAGLSLWSGCDCSGDLPDGRGRPCDTTADCASGFECVDSMCRALPAPGTDGGPGPVGSCSSVPPMPIDERCNGVDDDCDGTSDEGVLSTCGDCDPSCMGEHVGVGGMTPFDPEGHTDGSESDAVGLDPTGALVLDSRRIETAFIWIANTGNGTVSKVDTRTRVEVARYRTGPSDGVDPSRTTVNSLGDVYVGNRAGQSATKISVLGADCPDTNGDGTITTSTGPTDVLPWGQDDCVLWHASLPDGGIIRSMAAQDTYGPDGEIITAVWVGGWDGIVWKLDGETGAILVRTASPSNNYGFALDGSGNLWISGRSGSRLGRIDTNRCTSTAACDVAPCAEDTCMKQQIPVPSGYNPYGITVDAAQRVWIANHGSGTIARYDHAAAGARWEVTSVGANCHGIAADGSGWVWAACDGLGVVRLLADDPSMWTAVAGSEGRGAKGMAVDFDGQIWCINLGSGNDATVIVPGPGLMDYTVDVGVVPVGITRYTYSDMTGQQLRLATDPRGWYRRPFEGCPEGSAATVWRDLRFEGDAPPGTLFRFRVRTAPTRAELAAAMWILVGEAPPGTSPLDVGAALTAAGVEHQQWIEVEVQLEAMRASATEIISPRLESMTVTRECGPLLM
ncbi:MAG: hypothetical protein M3Y87_16150 [Myxococcota bacterium]|nr:hypothetical protein [Myxococcota bacterium]